MRRLQFLFALLVTGVLVAVGFAAQELGPKPAATVMAEGTTTGAWFCPHGGGDGWATEIHVANPGSDEVRVRVTEIDSEGRQEPTDYTLAPGTVQRFEASSQERASSSMVEYFGGWVAAGWVTEAGKDDSGVAAEPCLPEAGSHLFLPDGSTQSGSRSFVIVMNPFNAEAVFTMKLRTAKEQPITTTDLTNYVLKPHHSVAFELNDVVLDDTVAAEVTTTLGRVTAASLGVSGSGGIRSAGAIAAAQTRWILPGGLDNESASVVVYNAGKSEVMLLAELYTDEAEQTAAGTNNQRVAARTARTFSGLTSSPSTIELSGTPVTGQGPSQLVAVRRTYGVDGDQGATSGQALAASSWVVLPSMAGPPQSSRVLLANPGDVDAQATVTFLGPDGIEAETDLAVPARRTIQVPTSLTDREPLAAIRITCSQGVVVPASVGYSSGFESYAVSAGLPIPQE